MNKPIKIIIGGQYGSEAKGTITSHICRTENTNIIVRTGSINAGHTVYHEGKPYKMQQIPVGWVNKNTKLILGAGTYIHPEILEREVRWIAEATGEGIEGVKNRLYIDKRCGVHLPDHHKQETDAKLHERMGSTGEGVAAAIVDKMNRKFEYKLFSQTEYAKGYKVCDTVELLNNAYDNMESILIEGTQGTMLDFHLGHYPYVTSRQTTASAWLTECGLSPSLETEVIMVIRTCPIRVAGNSGPLPNEISWVGLAREINLKLDGKPPIISENALIAFEVATETAKNTLGLSKYSLESMTPEERSEKSEELSSIYQLALKSLDSETLNEVMRFFEVTTVTKKLRRIAHIDLDELSYTSMINRPTYVALTFLNYIFPTLMYDSPLREEHTEYIRKIEEITKSKVRYYNVDPHRVIEL